MNITNEASPNYSQEYLNFDQSLTEGAKKILSYPWWDPKEKNPTSLSSRGECISQVQGCMELRRVTVEQLSKNMDVFSPALLRQHKEINPITYRIIWSKDVAHVFSLDGKVDCSKTSLSGYNETFALPQLVSRFKHFVNLHPQLISSEKYQTLCLILENAIWHDNISEKKIDLITKKILDPLETLPILIGSGWDWHSTQIIFFKFRDEDFFIYGNCGNDSGITPGWSVFKINNKEKITPEWIHNLADRLSAHQKNYTNLERIKKDLEATAIYYCHMKVQRVGNCTYKSLKTALYSLLFILNLDPKLPIEVQLDKSIGIQNDIIRSLLVPKIKDIYKQFTNFDRQIVAKDLLIDLNHVIKNGDNLKETDVEFLFIEIVTKAMYGKILETPTLIFQLGPELWKELVISCEKILKPSILLDNRLLQYVDSLKWEPGNRTNDQVLELALLFFTQKDENVWFGNDILKLLMQRGLLMDALRDAELSSIDSEAIQSCKNPTMFLFNYFNELHSSNQFEKAERIAKIVSNEPRRSEVLMKISNDYAQKKSFDKAELIIALILDPWKKTIANLNLAYHMALEEYKPTSELECLITSAVDHLSQSEAFKLFFDDKSKSFSDMVDYSSIKGLLGKIGTLMTERGLTKEAQLIERLMIQIYKEKPINVYRSPQAQIKASHPPAKRQISLQAKLCMTTTLLVGLVSLGFTLFYDKK